eukprot:748360-Hanusia_phi.AAC.2
MRIRSDPCRVCLTAIRSSMSGENSGKAIAARGAFSMFTWLERWREVGQPQKPSPPSTMIFLAFPSAIIARSPIDRAHFAFLPLASLCVEKGVERGEGEDRKDEEEAEVENRAGRSVGVCMNATLVVTIAAMVANFAAMLA